ncbi:hypothetical protein PCANB_000924 [Pneumocystis canis]|nr:hypothetical protein PCANB_000924 [Pneumocystis canis]
MSLGKALHLSIDLLLVSSVLAGIKRSTGLTIRKDLLDNDVGNIVETYLHAGDWLVNQSVAWMDTSKYFERKK